MIQNSPCCIETNNQALKVTLDCITNIIDHHQTVKKDTLESILQLVAVNLKSLIDQYAEKCLDEGHLQLLCDKIKELDLLYCEKHYTIHLLHETALKGLYQRAVSPTNPIHNASSSYASWAWNGLANTISYLTPKPLKDQFIDENHPWKQKKYELNFFLMNEALALDYSKPLTLLLEEISSFDEFECPLRNPTVEILQLLLASHKSCREGYTRFMSKLREILSSPTFSEERKKKQLGEEHYDPCIDLLLKICYYRFTGIHIYSFCRAVIRFIIDKGKEALEQDGLKTEPAISLSEVLGKEFKAIERAPVQAPKLSINRNKLKGTLNIGFDPHLNSNMPYTLYDVCLDRSLGRTVHTLRIGTPTHQRYNSKTMTWQGEAYIIPEFENFVWALSHCEKKKLLHISLQDDTERSFCTESERTKALKAFQGRFPEHFFVAIFSQDSRFYYQRELFSKSDDAVQFKTLFLSEHLIKDKGFYFPEAWLQDKQFISEVQRLLNAVHEDIFGGRSKLDLAERLDFIEIYYARLALYLIQYSGADYFFFCCKDSVDRAAKSNALLLYLLLVLQGSENIPEYIEILDTYVHAAAMLVKKQAMNVDRRQRFLSALSRLEKSKDFLREKWGKEFPRMDPIKVVKSSNFEFS